ncbi:putative uDP-N-acetylmuramoylalanyl-D-glutamyl-2, 6-diamino pimelate--D-alanyl-D-alanyl ligase [Burkholderia thailandensis]|uniref:UDP-N-acetylmuramoylalanyl-D-glutamyl-2, 6-diamino pimelate--D-alanyl-D-alanyl ligase n=1 Tax=Burkholderia thailandensis TaxID=57975 RepID=A0AAW9D5T0_BURTH|nr:putative uDP-N-acetylmuramoylalanyl-D-glutamyl-2, 6-diamino pimelate--D-alanyl-D-alanyl ligase [Burkholderia thailandensis]
MTMLTLREAAAMIPGATVLGDERASFERVSTDSRSAGPGDLFVALKGSVSMRTTSSATSPRAARAPRSCRAARANGICPR